MTTALSIVAQNTGASEEDIKNVISGMIISSKNQHGATASNAEIAVFTGVCSKYALNPLVKECTAFVSGGKLQAIVMIDGWYKMVNRQENFDGVEFEDKFGDDGKIISITCKMHIKNRSHPACVTEYLAECMDKKSTVWTRWPARMLRHKAYIQAARIAFGISEVIDDDEARRIDSKPITERDITPQSTVDFKAIELAMKECGDLETLKAACGDIREKMQTDGTWNANKDAIIALNIKHKDRINSYVVEEIDTDTPHGMSEANEPLVTNEEKDALFGSDISEGELVEDDDIGFGEDDSDEFGE